VSIFYCAVLKNGLYCYQQGEAIRCRFLLSYLRKKKTMLTAETKTATANLNAKLSFNIKLTVQEKLLLLSAIRANIKQQLDLAETFHGEHYAASSFENVGKLTRIEQALASTHPKQEVTQEKKFDLFN